MLKKVRHIGIVTQDLERTLEKFKGFGLQATELTEIKEICLKIAFIPVGDTLIELLFYTAPPKKGYQTIVRSQKGSINHICFEVDDLGASIQQFEKTGAKLIEDFPMNGAHGRVAFFYPESTEGVLIELCQV